MSPPYEPRHELPDDVAAALRAARLDRGLGLREAARKAGINPGYFTLLEQGERCPSVAVARVLIAALELGPELAGQLLEVARPDAGRSRPESACHHSAPGPSSACCTTAHQG